MIDFKPRHLIGEVMALICLLVLPLRRQPLQP